MATIEERVVSLKFNNAGFEKGVQTSIDSLKRLASAMKNGVSGAASGLASGTGGVSGILSGIRDAASNATQGFTVLNGAAAVTLGNIATRAVDAGMRMVQALTTKPMIDGMREYETQLNAVQTILANTAHKGENIQTVNAALDELNEYADKTIYNFGEMTRNIGTFTAAGVGLKDSVQAIKGISNLAAMSGSNAQQASTAMYQLSQALSTGTVRLMDWNSVVNAGMGGEVFQEALKRTARAHGVAVDEIIAKNGSFRDSLQEGWLSAAIMQETLAQFTGDLSKEQLISMGYTEQQADEMMRLAEEANKAAVTVKSFSQLLGTLAEGLGSGWAQTWRIIFGDLEQARALWTSVSNFLGGIINRSAEARNHLLKGWADLGGREQLIAGLANLFKAIWAPLEAIGRAFSDTFGGPSAKNLYEITVRFRQLTEHLLLSGRAAQNIRRIFGGIFSIIRIGLHIVTQFGKIIFYVLGGVAKVLYTIASFFMGGALNVAGEVGSWIKSFEKWITSMDPAGAILDWITARLESFKRVLNDSTTNIGKFFAAIKSFGSKVSGGFSNLIGDLPGFFSAIGNFASDKGGQALDWMSSRFETVKMGAIAFGGALADVLAPQLKNVQEAFSAFWETVKQVGSEIKQTLIDKFHELAEKFGFTANTMKPLSEYANKVGHATKDLAQKTADIVVKMAEWGAKTGEFLVPALEWLAEVLTSATTGVVDFGAAVGGGVADAIGFLAEKLVVLKDTLGNFFTGTVGGWIDKITGMKDAADGLSGSVTTLLSASEATGATGGKNNVFSQIAEGYKEMAENAKPSLLDKIKNGLLSFGRAIKGFFTESMFSYLPDPMQGILAGFTRLDLLKVRIKMAFQKIGDTIKKAFQSVINVLKDDELVDNVLKIFDRVLGSALIVQGFMFLRTMEKYVKSVTGVLDGLSGIFESVSKNIEAMAMRTKAQTILIIAGALLVLAAALYVLSMVPSDKIAVSMAAIGGSLILMILTMKALDAIFSDENAMETSKLIATAIALMALAAAVLIMASAVKKIGELKATEVLKGVAAAGAIMAFLAVWGNISKNPVTIGNALALLAVSYALVQVGTAVKKLAEIPWKTFLKGAGYMATTLAMIVAAMHFMPPWALAKAVLITAVVGALLMAAGVIKVFASLPWKTYLKGIAMMSVVLLMLVMAVSHMNTAAVGSLAILAVAASMMVLAGVIATLGNLSWQTLAKGILAMAAALAVLVVAAAVAQGLSLGFLLLTAALLAFGYATMMVAVSIALVVGSFALLMMAIVALSAVGLPVLQGLISLIPALGTALADAFVNFWAVIAENRQKITDGFSTLLGSLLQAIIDNIPKMETLFSNLIDAGLRIVRAKAPDIIDTGWYLIITFLNSARQKIPEITNIAIDLVLRFCRTVRSRMPELTNEAANMIITFMRSLAQTIREKQNEVKSAAREVGSAIISGMTGGLSDKVGSLARSAANAAKSALQSAKDFLGIKSPSREFRKVGRWSMEGFIIGIDGMNSDITKSSKAAGQNAIESVKKALEDNDDFDLGFNDDAPVITPVLDLSNVEKGSDDISKLLDNKRIDLTGSNVSADLTARTMNPSTQPVQQVTNITNKTVNFEQNNNSPKALSAIEIYRDTKAVLAQARNV